MQLRLASSMTLLLVEDAKRPSGYDPDCHDIIICSYISSAQFRIRNSVSFPPCGLILLCI